MDRQELHDLVIKFTKEMYDANTKPDYDLDPMVHMLVNDEHHIAVLMSGPDGSPFDMLAMLLEEQKPDAMCFVSPIWRKDPDTMERTGEGLMILSETRKERQGSIYVVERNPLPVLTEEEVNSVDYTPRMKLLYEPSVLQ